MLKFIALQRENTNKAVIAVEGDPPDIDELIKRLVLGTAVQVPVVASEPATAPVAPAAPAAPRVQAPTVTPTVTPADPKTTRVRASTPVAPVAPVAPPVVEDEDGNELDEDDDAPPAVGVLFTGAVPETVKAAAKISPMVTALLQAGVLPVVTGQAGVDAVVQWCTEAYHANAVALLKTASKDLADMQTRVKRSASLALGVST